MRRGIVNGKKPIELKSSFLLGTHHKTGTVWMGTLLGNFCRDTYRKMSTVPLRAIEYTDISSYRPTALFDWFSIFHDPFEYTKDYKGVSIIRHPKDQIISSTRYHQTAVEPWLLYKRDNFGGMSYQEKLCSLESWEEKVAFEMTHSSLTFSKHMINHRPNLINVRYEDLVDGYPRPEVFSSMFDYLEFDDEDRQVFEKYYVDTHMNNSENLHESGKNHILNGSSYQWTDMWPSDCDNLYNKYYIHIEKELGY